MAGRLSWLLLVLAGCAATPTNSVAPSQEFLEERPTSIRVTPPPGELDKITRKVLRYLKSDLEYRGYEIASADEAADAEMWFFVVDSSEHRQYPGSKLHASVQITAGLDSLATRRSLWEGRGYGVATEDEDDDEEHEHGFADALFDWMFDKAADAVVEPDYDAQRKEAAADAIDTLLKDFPAPLERPSKV